MMKSSKLGIYTASTLKHSYALKAQARAIQSACIYAKIKNPTIVVVCSNEDFFDEVGEEYRSLLPEANVRIIKKEDFYDCKNRKNYKNEVQLMIAQMRTLATRELLAMGCDRILSMDSDVLPKYNSIRCMLDMLSFDNGFYDVAQCPYPSQGGGSFLGGGGTKQRQILEDFKEEELKIPKDLKRKLKKERDGLNKYIKDLEEKKVKVNEEDNNKIEKKRKSVIELEEEAKKCPPKDNVFGLNGKAWRKRGWFDYAYPAIGKGSIVPVDWVGFGCTMMSQKAAALCDFTGYIGSGTEDLYIVWNRWYQNNINIANIPHCPSDHIIRDRDVEGQLSHIFTYHEEEGEFKGHLRQEKRPWYSQDIGEGCKEEQKYKEEKKNKAKKNKQKP